MVVPKSPGEVGCSEEWLESVGWSAELPLAERSEIYRRHAAEIAEVKEKLWQRHYASLPEAERAMLDDDTHPSYSWGFAERAAPYAVALREQLGGVEFVESVGLGWYHGDTIVLTVRLTRRMPWREYRPVVPELFRGFQVFVVPP